MGERTHAAITLGDYTALSTPHPRAPLLTSPIPVATRQFSYVETAKKGENRGGGVTTPQCHCNSPRQ